MRFSLILRMILSEKSATFRDHALARSFEGITVLEKIAEAKPSMSAWEKARNKPNANIFLAALLLGRSWNP
jgi:hypothetical protein